MQSLKPFLNARKKARIARKNRVLKSVGYINKTGQIRKYRIRLARALGRFGTTSVQILSYLRINVTFFCWELALMRSCGARSLRFSEPLTRWKYGIDSKLIVLIGSCFWGKLVLKISFMRTSENDRDVIGWHSIKIRTAWRLRFVCCLIFWSGNDVYYICCPMESLKLANH